MTDESKTYTVDQIKEAFWKTFHKQGEFGFNYFGTDEQNEDSTRCEWTELLEHLREGEA